MELNLSDIMTTGGAVVGASGFTGWLLKQLITKYMKDNDAKHKATDEAIEEVDDKVDDLKVALVGLSSKLDITASLFESFRGIESTVRDDHDKVVDHASRLVKLEKDINHSFQCKREMEDKIEDLEKEMRQLTELMVNLKLDTVTPK